MRGQSSISANDDSLMPLWNQFTVIATWLKLLRSLASNYQQEGKLPCQT